MIRIIDDKNEKEYIVRTVLEELTEWFGITESRECYITDSREQITIADIENGKPRGFLCLKETGKDTVELSVMGVLKEYHRQGIGRNLFRFSEDVLRGLGYSFFQVKTVQMGKYKDYDNTNLFYISLSFKEFEVIPTLWDENNPCQIYVKTI